MQTYPRLRSTSWRDIACTKYQLLVSAGDVVLPTVFIKDAEGLFRVGGNNWDKKRKPHTEDKALFRAVKRSSILISKIADHLIDLDLLCDLDPYWWSFKIDLDLWSLISRFGDHFFIMNFGKNMHTCIKHEQEWLPLRVDMLKTQ